MGRFIKSRYRYPIFFMGLFLMEIAGFLFRYLSLPLQITEVFVAVGFLLFVISAVAP